MTIAEMIVEINALKKKVQGLSLRISELEHQIPYTPSLNTPKPYTIRPYAAG